MPCITSWSEMVSNLLERMNWSTCLRITCVLCFWASPVPRKAPGRILAITAWQNAETFAVGVAREMMDEAGPGPDARGLESRSPLAGCDFVQTRFCADWSTLTRVCWDDTLRSRPVATCET